MQVPRLMNDYVFLLLFSVDFLQFLETLPAGEWSRGVEFLRRDSELGDSEREISRYHLLVVSVQPGVKRRAGLHSLIVFSYHQGCHATEWVTSHNEFGHVHVKGFWKHQLFTQNLLLLLLQFINKCHHLLPSNVYLVLPVLHMEQVEVLIIA